MGPRGGVDNGEKSKRWPLLGVEQRFFGHPAYNIRHAGPHVQLSQYLIKPHAMEAYGELQVQLHPFLVISFGCGLNCDAREQLTCRNFKTQALNAG